MCLSVCVCACVCVCVLACPLNNWLSIQCHPEPSSVCRETRFILVMKADPIRTHFHKNGWKSLSSTGRLGNVCAGVREQISPSPPFPTSGNKSPRATSACGILMERHNLLNPREEVAHSHPKFGSRMLLDHTVSWMSAVPTCPNVAAHC